VSSRKTPARPPMFGQMFGAELPDLPGAACRDHPDPDMFHPRRARGVNASVSSEGSEGERRAVAFCRAHCPDAVRAECLAYALQTSVLGVWGGLREIEIEELRAARAAV
jgi:hypothetical protein